MSVAHEKFRRNIGFTEKCPKILVDRAKKIIGRAKIDKGALFEILKMIRAEFDPILHKITTTRQFQQSRFVSAQEVFKKRLATCGTLSSIAACVLRALGVPTKLIHGYLDKKTDDHRHAWNEAIIRGKWLSFDITRPDFKVGERHIKESEWTDWSEMERGYERDFLKIEFGKDLEVWRVKNTLKELNWLTSHGYKPWLPKGIAKNSISCWQGI